ncbi:MAG: hypothetical protein IT521_04825 [Burkholderiales bacterium]|nr:hypothetical protein [Burkholderiales bacterium]
MRTSTPTRSTATRFLATLLAWTFIFGQTVQGAYAVTTPLADVPIAAKVAAKPNIVYTLDDSGSMQYNYLPDYLTSTSATVNINLSRVGSVATSSSNSAFTALNVGDWVSIIGANQPEYNGYFQITDKPTTTKFSYDVTGTPATPATVAPGYGYIQVVTSTAYCRGGNFTTPCTQQRVDLSQGYVTLDSMKRASLAAGGPVTATAIAPVSAQNLLQTLAVGDSVLIQHTPTQTIPATTSAPYYGLVTIDSITANAPSAGKTTFTYTIDAVAGVTPTTAGGNRRLVTVTSQTYAAPPMHAADFNRLAYNPDVTYIAPVGADGLPLTLTGTDASGNYGTSAFLWNSASVDRDPYSAFETLAGATPMWSATTRDTLGAKVNVALYCNTDWPLLVNDSNWPSGPNGANVLDVGNANAQYSAGSGAWCRINGTRYDASAASGAAATAVAGVEMGYNYPWRSSNGTTDPDYFYQQLSVKSLWCDQSSPHWPQDITSVITGCDDFSTPTGGSTTPQTCDAGTPANICNPVGALRTYETNKAPIEACDTSATFCSPPGSGLSPECRTCSCVADTPRTPYTCSISGVSCGCVGAGCAALSTCPDIVVPPTACATGNPIYSNSYSPKASVRCDDQTFDPVLKTNTGPTMLEDAGAPGTTGAPGNVCRHNNYTYAVGGASGLFKYGFSPYTFPGEGTGTGTFNKRVTSACPAVGTTIPIPRHYYVVDGVQFCDDRVVTVNGQWRGFGTGVCQDKNDLGGHSQVKYGPFTRIDLFATNTLSFAGTSTLPPSATPYPNGRVFLAGVTPGPDNSESINYANWYAYYSTRLLAGKTTSAIAFSYLTTPAGEATAYRVGFHNLGEEPDPYGGGTPIIFVNVLDWDLTQRTQWYDSLFGIAVNNFKTPTIDAMLRIGNLFETGGAAGVDTAKVNPLPATTASGAALADPISLDGGGNPVSCHNNYHILFTDGKTNQVALPTTAGDQDQTIPASLAGITEVPPDQVLPNLKLGGAWPAPFQQGAPAVSDTLADVAAYYWSRDLRPTLKNDVPASSGKVSVVGVVGQGDLDWTKDVAYWQHVNFNAISFGADGVLDATNQPATLSDIIAGTALWPNLTQPNNPIYPRGSAAGAVAVDDLWRATMMSRGSFVYARSPIEVSYGLANILAGIQNQRKSRVGAAFGGQVLNAANNVIYEATIEPGWAGDLLKVQIDPATGAEVQTWWKASETLRDQIDPLLAGVDEPWMNEAHRRVVTLTGSAGPGVPFRRANLSAAMQASLAPTALRQEKIVSYLRGGNTYTPAVGPTVTIEGTSIGQFRKRFGALGDISNAQPVIVTAPKRPYIDLTDPGYSTYVSSNSARSTNIVAPANDGMVHVFGAGPVNPVTAGGGNEVFAFIPRALFRGTAGSILTEDTTAIQALTYQDGGVPIYHHHMYVDSSPRAADVDFSGGAGTDWRTIVVGGLGKGGKSYYALDLTDAAAADEAAAANKVLWEWTHPEMGYSYGRPVIVKVRDSAYSKGRWVVIVTAGYNNITGANPGQGKVFFLDATDGTLLSTVTTSAGSATDPSGFAQIHAFVKNQTNQIAEQIYGGDLLGNLWRIDVSGVDAYKSASATLLATLTAPDGSVQPVTTAPQIEIDINNGVDRYVFIGTGRLLHDRDLTEPASPQTQTMYAIRDGTLSAIQTTGLPIAPRADLVPINADGVSAIVGGAPNGWYHDLPNVPGDSERIVVDVVADVNIAAYVGTKVQDDPCLISLPAKLYARDYTSARSLLLDSGGSTVAYMDFPFGAVGVTLVGRIQPDGTQSLGALVSGEVPGTKPVDIRNPVTGPGSRLSWRLLAPEQ